MKKHHILQDTLIYNIMSSIIKAEKFWNRLANQFDKLSKYIERPPSEKAKKFLSDNDIVLDFGCATGKVTIELSD